MLQIGNSCEVRLNAAKKPRKNHKTSFEMTYELGSWMVEKLQIYWVFRGKMFQKPNKTDKNRKKPVETEEIWLTKLAERLKVNCGTVLLEPHEH